MNSDITKDSVIKKLSEFNKYAEELFNLSFVKKLKGSGHTIAWTKEKGLETKFRGPDDEAIKAFVNDIRRFFQKGEDTLKIHKLIPFYQSDLIDESEKRIFNRVISEVNKFNGRSTNHIINEENITNERLLEVFLYGRYSHRSKGTKEIHDAWERIPPMYISLKSEFIYALSTYLRFINNILYANNQVLKKLSK